MLRLTGCCVVHHAGGRCRICAVVAMCGDSAPAPQLMAQFGDSCGALAGLNLCAPLLHPALLEAAATAATATVVL